MGLLFEMEDDGRGNDCVERCLAKITLLLSIDGLSITEEAVRTFDELDWSDVSLWSSIYKRDLRGFTIGAYWLSRYR